MKYNFEKSKILQGDCLEVMKNIPNASIDLIVTDPPYKMTKKGKKLPTKLYEKWYE